MKTEQEKQDPKGHANRETPYNTIHDRMKFVNVALLMSWSTENLLPPD